MLDQVEGLTPTTRAPSTPASKTSIPPGPWEQGPPRPRLAEGALHVWRADLEAVGDDLVHLLSDEERERANRLLGERDRRRWTRAHGVLRALLGRYLQRDPSSLRFAIGAHGKPGLAERATESGATQRSTTATSSGLSFNLSHSGHLALYAFTSTSPVGVDLELLRRPIDEVALATRMFGRTQARRLERLDPSTRRLEFLRLWVRHEAELKRRGTGFATVGGVGDERWGAEFELAPRAAAGAEPWIAELEVGSRAVAAVAT